MAFRNTRKQCLEVDRNILFRHVEQMCLPPSFSRKFDYEEINTIRPEQKVYNKLQGISSNQAWKSTIERILTGLLKGKINLQPQDTSIDQDVDFLQLPSYNPPSYTRVQSHKTAELLDAVMASIIDEEDINNVILGDALLTLRAVSAILYQQELIKDIIKTELPEYKAESPSTQAPCPTSKLDEISRRMESSPLLNDQDTFYRLIYVYTWQMLMIDYDLDADIPVSYLKGINIENMAQFRSLIADAIEFAQNFPLAALERRHFSSGFSKFVSEISNSCSTSWCIATVHPEDILHMMYALVTSNYGGGYRGIIKDMVLAARGHGDGDDEDADIGIHNPERAARAEMALQRKMSVDSNVLVNYIVGEDLHRDYLVGIIDRVASELGVVIRTSQLMPCPRELVEEDKVELVGFMSWRAWTW